MNRQEQITITALETYSCAVNKHLAMRVGFETGAKWADQHPSVDTVKKMFVMQ